jgi:hypothetical protein
LPSTVKNISGVQLHVPPCLIPHEPRWTIDAGECWVQGASRCAAIMRRMKSAR